LCHARHVAKKSSYAVTLSNRLISTLPYLSHMQDIRLKILRFTPSGLTPEQCIVTCYNASKIVWHFVTTSIFALIHVLIGFYNHPTWHVSIHLYSLSNRSITVH
jgi:hypothetical protein